MRILLEANKYPTPDELAAEARLTQAAQAAGHRLELVRPGPRPLDTSGYAGVISFRPRVEATMQLELDDGNDLLPKRRQPWRARLRRMLLSTACSDFGNASRQFYTQSAGLVASYNHQRLAQLRRNYSIDTSRCLQLTPPVALVGKLPSSPDERLARRAQARQSLHIMDSALLLLQRADEVQRHGLDRTVLSMASLPQEKRDQTHLLVLAPRGCGGLPGLRTLMGKHGLDAIRQLHVIQEENYPVEELLLAADILMHPVRTDDHPYMLTEALAAGMPVICTAECTFQHLAAAAGMPVLPTPFHGSTLDDALALVVRELANVTGDAAEAAALLLEGDWAAEAIAAAVATNVATPEPATSQLQPQELPELVKAHRRLCAAGKAIKNQAKRAVSRVELMRQDGFVTSYIVKEYRRPPWWHFKRQYLHTMKGTALLHSYTPACQGIYRDPGTGSVFLFFADCGSGCFFRAEYASRPDAPRLYAGCGEVLARLHASGIYHKDAKSANYVVNDHCQGECPYPVCLVDCDCVSTRKAPLPMALRVHNIAQFIASSGRLANANLPLFYRMMGCFRKGYLEGYRRLDRAEAAQLWRLAWREARWGKHIERNLPEEAYLL